ncbi:MAG: tetratricopeptide repeat protein [Deltaproteobacteria bacterium]|nr:tetratricopeptide repeat protein [Deltaproteobacteria bacterium]
MRDARLRRFAAALLACFVALSASPVRAAHRVVVLGIDGLDPDVIELLVSEGKLPTFAKLRKGGAYGRLRSSEPILSPIIWTTITTGKPPGEHGIGDFTAINEKTGERLPVTSQMRKVKALWSILTEAGKSVGVVGWWATWPAESVNGVLVSDHTCYHFLFEGGITGAESTLGIIHPTERTGEITALVRRPADVRHEEIEDFVSVNEEEFARPFAFEDDLGHFKWAWATAESYRRIGLEIWKKDHPDLLMVYVEGVDSSSHLFGHLFRAEGLGGELAEQQKRFGKTVEQMYVYADGLVAEYLAALGEDATLVVLSDHGFELAALPEDPSKTRDMRRVSAKNHRIDGILYLYGESVKPGAAIQGAKLVDVAPTVLALEGIAPAKDMSGRVLLEGLDLPEPERTVATFEGGADDTSKEEVADASVDPAILSRLEALGYLEAESPRGERNLAAIAFEDGRYEEAIVAYRAEVEKNPDDASAHASLAGALGALERYDEAIEHLDTAIRLNPLGGSAYHNRAVIHERRGERDEAIDDYRKAVRYGQGYPPSREALRRLTGSGRVDDPQDEAEQKAAALAREASLAARKGRYDEAMKLLDQAQAVAPKYVLVHQYRSNVAFLMGDRKAAIASLEAGLALEPENPLFRTNLKRLQEGSAQPSQVPSRLP